MTYSLIQRFDKEFGICTLSLCDEHEKAQCSRCLFRAFLKRELNPIPRGRKQVLENRESIRHLHSQGYSQRQIQRILGFKSVMSVSRHLKKLGLTHQKKPNP
jgi:hypothetical protein